MKQGFHGVVSTKGLYGATEEVQVLLTALRESLTIGGDNYRGDFQKLDLGERESGLLGEDGLPVNRYAEKANAQRV